MLISLTRKRAGEMEMARVGRAVVLAHVRVIERKKKSTTEKWPFSGTPFDRSIKGKIDAIERYRWVANDALVKSGLFACRNWKNIRSWQSRSSKHTPRAIPTPVGCSIDPWEDFIRTGMGPC